LVFHLIPYHTPGQGSKQGFVQVEHVSGHHFFVHLGGLFLLFHPMSSLLTDINVELVGGTHAPVAI